jgi:hypothetical protein
VYDYDQMVFFFIFLTLSRLTLVAAILECVSFSSSSCKQKLKRPQDTGWTVKTTGDSKWRRSQNSQFRLHTQVPPPEE